MKIIFPYFRRLREASRRGTTSIDKSYKSPKLSKFQVQVEETIICNFPLGVKLILSSPQVCHRWSMLPFRVSSALRLFQCCLLVYTALVKFPMKKKLLRAAILKFGRQPIHMKISRYHYLDLWRYLPPRWKSVYFEIKDKDILLLYGTKGQLSLS